MSSEQKQWHHPQRVEEARQLEDVDAKILKYERFIDEKLRPDLNRVLEKRSAIDKELAD